MPKPDEFGWYRVKVRVGRRIRHYSTKALQGVHEASEGPASDRYGNPYPPKFSPADEARAPEQPPQEAIPANTEANKEAEQS